ncbi:MAG TPA: hypothetical protein EYP49_21135, partial [Anaerolineae bacterium]|nr:hypothetical protein [Anaerolineae bacterium]
MLTKRWIATFVAVVTILSLLAACGPTPTPEVIEKVVKETVVVEKEVEVTKVVEKEVEVTVEVPVGAELVTIVARCRAKPPMEDWRCNNLLDA